MGFAAEAAEAPAEPGPELGEERGTKGAADAPAAATARWADADGPELTAWFGGPGLALAAWRRAPDEAPSERAGPQVLSGRPRAIWSRVIRRVVGGGAAVTAVRRWLAGGRPVGRGWLRAVVKDRMRLFSRGDVAPWPG